MKKIAWGITGAGDQLNETLNLMIGLTKKFGTELEIDVYLSKAGKQVAEYYQIEDILSKYFSKINIERDANKPFLAGKLQTGIYELLIIAPATSNTVAKIRHGIADTMLTNGALQALKAYVPVYIMPTDYEAGETVTDLPNGKKLKLRVRKEDAENVEKIRDMDGIHPFKRPDFINEMMKKHFIAFKPE